MWLSITPPPLSIYLDSAHEQGETLHELALAWRLLLQHVEFKGTGHERRVPFSKIRTGT